MDPQTKPAIPAGLNTEERKVWEKLLQVKAQREKNNEAAPRVVIVTDLPDDIDDLLTLIELIPLDNLGLIK